MLCGRSPKLNDLLTMTPVPALVTPRNGSSRGVRGAEVDRMGSDETGVEIDVAEESVASERADPVLHRLYVEGVGSA